VAALLPMQPRAVAALTLVVSRLLSCIEVVALPSAVLQVHRSHQAFASRQELLDYEAALRHAGQLTDALEVSAGRLCIA